MDLRSKKFIQENVGKQKTEEIARILNLKERVVRREIERLENKKNKALPKSETYGFSLPGFNRLALVFCLFLVVVAGIYSNTLQSPFQYDDIYYIREHPALHNLADLSAIWKWDAPRFLPNLTFALNYQLGALNVLGYHLLNILIHGVTGFMVYLFILTLFQTPRLKGHFLAGRSGEVALFAGLLFVVHPIQIQAVTYIVQRHTSFATLFYVTTCFLYVVSRLRQSEKFYRLAILFCVAAMFTKQITFTLPAAILLCECFLFETGNSGLMKTRLVRLTPFFLTMLILPGLRFFQILGHGADQFAETSSITPLHYLFTQFNVIVTYLLLLFWPSGQSIYHSFPVSFTLMEPRTLLSLYFLIALFWTALALREKHPAIAFGVFWLFLTLTVESSVIPIQHVIFEHRMYLPMMGLCLALSVMLAWVIKNRRVFGAVVMIFVLVLGFNAYKRNEVWKTSRSLWQDAIEKYKGSSNQRMLYDEAEEIGVEERIENKPFDQWRQEEQ